MDITINTSHLNQKRKKPIIVSTEKEMDKPVKGLDYIANQETEILILGTFPANESLKAGFYYQNQIKRFWSQALGFIASLDKLSNSDRLKILLSKRIGLWDIFEYVERSGGNQDSAIIKAKYNDINMFLDHFPKIKYLIFNGSNSYNWLTEDRQELFKNKKLELIKLQSSSGSNGHFNAGKDWLQYFNSILNS